MRRGCVNERSIDLHRNAKALMAPRCAPKARECLKMLRGEPDLGNILSPVASPRAEIPIIKRDEKLIDYQVY